MKNLLAALTLVIGLSAAAHAGVSPVITDLPGSDDSASSIVVAYSTGAVVVVVSSSAITQLDTTVNAALLANLGATYRRAAITVQNTGSVAIYVSYYATGWTTSTGGFKLAVGDVWTFSVGKVIHLYSLSTAGTAGEARVAAVGYKNL